MVCKLCATPLPKRDGPSCAVVGSADFTRASGSAIDRYDRVWRLNDAPTVGFEHLVGAKTTDRLLNRVSVSVWSGQQYIEYKEMHHRHRSRAFHPSLCYDIPCMLIDDVNPSLIQAAKLRFPNISLAFDEGLRSNATICGYKSTDAERRSAGFVAIVAALRVCRSPVRLFGFHSDCCNNETRAYKYYHNEHSKWVCCSQGRENMGAERAVIKSLEARGLVNSTDEGALVHNASHVPVDAGLESPTFKAMPLRPSVPTGGLFVSCTNASRVLCAVRQNSSARMVLIMRGDEAVASIDDADDPRVFHHNGVDWILNNNYYRTSMIELRANGSLGREIRVPITQTKNLVPISWSRTHFFLMDVQDKALWPAQLSDAVTVLIKRPIPLTIQRTAQTACAVPNNCNHRGGTQGVHLSSWDEFAYGAGHCTGTVRVKSQTKLVHSAYWWTLNLAKRRLSIQDMCFSKRQLIDPSALYPWVIKGFSPHKNTTWKRKIWILATTEADDVWNSSPNQTYYNVLYRAPQRVATPRSPSPRVVARPRPPPKKQQSWLRHTLQSWQRWFRRKLFVKTPWPPSP